MTSLTRRDRQIPLVLKYRQNRLVLILLGIYALVNLLLNVKSYQKLRNSQEELGEIEAKIQAFRGNKNFDLDGMQREIEEMERDFESQKYLCSSII